MTVMDEFPSERPGRDGYDDMSVNLHTAKVRKFARTGEWYVLEKRWGWQIDGVFVWLHRGDSRALVRYTDANRVDLLECSYRDVV